MDYHLYADKMSGEISSKPGADSAWSAVVVVAIYVKDENENFSVAVHPINRTAGVVFVRLIVCGCHSQIHFSTPQSLVNVKSL